MDGIIKPPVGLLNRLVFYGRRYGYLHAVCSFIGRYYFSFWKIVGPKITKRYLRNWLYADTDHILNLGGGNVIFDRWLTADIDPRSDVYVDVTSVLPFPDESIDVIYCEEVIEHIDRMQGEMMLKECMRILKSEGCLRLTTPSLDWFTQRAKASYENVSEINDIFYLHGHRYIYSVALMEVVLSQCGFVNIYQSSYRDPYSLYGFFDTHAVRHPTVPADSSQYWEVQKP